MTTQIRRTGRVFSLPIVVSAVAKVICGGLLAVMVVAVWQQFDELEKQRALSAAWADTKDFAVFYPRLVGDDPQSGDKNMDIAVARDLYPVLDEAGALFIDARNYKPGVPSAGPVELPVLPIRVNLNYLERYPILDDSGAPIKVNREEQAWVVAVPEQFKSQEAAIKAYFQNTRTGGQGFQGAVQGQEDFLGEPVPEELVDQNIRIIWTASGQEVFSFNSDVDPDGGHMIIDPIVEIMTPANSMTVDRLNSITGDMNTALKVRVDGDPAATLRELTPLLTEVHLDDNFPYLVTGQEVIIGEVAKIRSSIAWLAAFALAALLVMLAFSATLVATTSDRLRRKLTVLRLHGFGFMRTYRELLVIVGVAWLCQLLLAGVIVVLMEVIGSGGTPNTGVDPFSQAPKLLTILSASYLIEALFVVATANIIERRNAVTRLKEL
ncbi:MAG: hypothetical protein ACRDT8_12095 [Micromonosporaceae bacterium]